MMKKIAFLILFLAGNWAIARAQCDSSYLSTTLQAGQWLGDYAWSFVTITPEQEEQAGDEMFAYIEENFRLLPDDPRAQKLRRILNKMLPFVKRPEIKYDIHLVEDDALINAFSIAGGHLFVTTGIMDWVQSDDELAFIIGHEIAHVDLEHCIRHVKRSMTIQTWAEYLQMGDYAGLIDQVQGVLGTPFGQVDEYQSDREGAYLTWKAGYNPRKGQDFFRKLQAQESPGELPYDLDVLLRTHPYSMQRIDCLEHYIAHEMKK